MRFRTIVFLPGRKLLFKCGDIRRSLSVLWNRKRIKRQGSRVRGLAQKGR
jgi:hypothetical protein